MSRYRSYYDESRLVRQPLVTVCIATYNHEHYIAQAIRSVIGQKFNSTYQVVIADDASSDQTLEICRAWQVRYPEKIKLFGWEDRKNVGMRNLEILFQNCNSKYVAFCDGDDYWTDVLKLQKQVDYMEMHQDCAICFHPVLIHWDEGIEPDSVYPRSRWRFKRTAPSLSELLRTNYIQLNSALYRWNADGRLFEAPLFEAMPADWMINLMHARCGCIGYLDEIMAVYRRHDRGIWTGNFEQEEWICKYGYLVVKFYRWLEIAFGVNCQCLIRRLVLATLGVDKRTKELLSIMCPSIWWVRLSGSIAIFYRCLMFFLGPWVAGLRRRYGIWRIVFVHRDRISDLISKRSVT